MKAYNETLITTNFQVAYNWFKRYGEIKIR